MLHQQGKLLAAEKSYKKAIKINHKFPEAHNNLGNVLIEKCQYKDAEASYREALSFIPNHAMILNNIGNALQNQGKNKEAIGWLKKAILSDASYADAYNNLGNALSELGMLEEAAASYKNAIGLNPNLSETYIGLGVVMKGLGKQDEALENCNRAIQLKPDNAEAYNNRGNALADLGRQNEALENYNRAIQLKPDYAEAYNNRGNALADLGRQNEALENCNRAIRLKPDYAEAYNNRGNALAALGRQDEALENYNRAIRLKPDYAEAHNNRGNALADLGRQDEALENYNRAIRLKPDYAEAYRHLSCIKQYKPDDSQISIMNKLYAKENLKESNHMHLSFALAKSHEDLGEYTKSFRYLLEGNQLRKKELRYSIDKDRKLFSIIQKIFDSKPSISDFMSNNALSIRPIFIVGMPRSGTSLVEQILASHSKIYGAGELEAMNRIIAPILSDLAAQNSSEHLNLVFQNKLGELRKEYFAILERLETTERIIVDKMPINFRWIGFILTAFPEATIIHTKRDPIATCWSIFKHFFSSKGNGYAYDMNDLAEYYKLYINLMAFWRKQFPSRIYDLSYDDLTEYQEDETRKLLQHCGLDWEQQCLYFYKTKRVVRTASATQVRKKMYKNSSKAWRKYEQHLQPMIASLECIS